MNPEVFICHSSVDARVANEICGQLEAGGVRCWIAPRDPVPGIPYGEQIVDAISAVHIVLLVFSKNANESQPVMNEVELASNRRKIILPVRVEDVAPSPSLEFYVRAIHWFDVTSRSREDAWPELVRDVQRLLGHASRADVDAKASVVLTTPKKSSNLPLQLTSFVGREHDVAEVKKLLAAHRLVTLVGSGGAGKTRAAIQIGGALLDSFSDGVLLVELAPVKDASLTSDAIARSLDVKESPDKSLLNAIVAHIREQTILLILDNCEHVIDEVRIICASILRSCPGVRILATSLESLGIAGERVFRLPSLMTPPTGERMTAKAALRYGAVALFQDRAQAADARFTVTDENAAVVAEITRRLDGIPLAIELAAARVNVLSPQQLAQRLDERFRVLTGGDRTALPRHQTMRALIDWSYELLSEEERALFRNVSIFVDGFTIEGAAAVFGDDSHDELTTLDPLTSLVDKSLAQTDPGTDDRYRLLESTRQYGQEKLNESGEFDESARRHLAYLRRLFQQAGAGYEATMSGATTSMLTVELEDARSALDWGERHAVADATDLFLASLLWVHLGLNREGIERAKRLIVLVGDGDAARLARLWSRIAVCAGRVGYYAVALDAAERSVPYARSSQDIGILADCLLTYADVIAHDQRFDEAVAALDEAEALGNATPRRRMQALHARGLIASIRGDLETAARCFAQVRELYASVGNDLGVVSAVLNLAEAEHARGDSQKAVEIARSELERAERLPNRGDWAFLMRNLAGYLNAVDDTNGAREAAQMVIPYYAGHDPEGPFTAIALEHLALSVALAGDLRTAATLEGYVEKTLTGLGFKREQTERITHERLMALLLQQFDRAELTELLGRGQRMSANEILSKVEYARV